MPPTPEQHPETPTNGIDPKSLLLPKKETGPNIDSAVRSPAGELLAQEQGATLPKAPASAPLVRLTPTPVAPTTAVEETEIEPLQTYKSDVASMVSEQGVSVVSVAAAEATRRGKEAHYSDTPEDTPLIPSWIKIMLSIVLLVIVAGTFAFLLLRPTSVAGPTELIAPLITADEDMAVPVSDTSPSRTEIMNALQAAKKDTNISLGLIEWLYLTNQEQTAQLGITELLGIIAPQTPGEIMRVLTETYFLGLHSFDENQPFLLLQVDSYETAYAGMLTWENTLQSDLFPFFNRIAVPRATPPVIIEPIATSTSSTTPEAPRYRQQFIPTSFVDKVVENRDTRAIVSDGGELLLLWTFLGRNTILITTNEYTLREVISRLTVTPVVPQPTDR